MNIARKMSHGCELLCVEKNKGRIKSKIKYKTKSKCRSFDSAEVRFAQDDRPYSGNGYQCMPVGGGAFLIGFLKSQTAAAQKKASTAVQRNTST
jgi:hypothetical protein